MNFGGKAGEGGSCRAGGNRGREGHGGEGGEDVFKGRFVFEQHPLRSCRSNQGLRSGNAWRLPVGRDTVAVFGYLGCLAPSSRHAI